MSRIVYLLGAGASYGSRGKDKLSFKTNIPGKDGILVEKEDCANIISGLPVVTEIPGRLSHMLNRLCNLYEDQQKDLNKPLLLSLINDLRWLRDATSKHATIDTFAKKLFLVRHRQEYQKLKNVLLAFLFFEQIINEPDQRYDSFLASVLQEDVNHLPEDISVISWNYDFQFELAYNGYVNCDNLSMLSEVYLYSHDKVSEGRGGEPYHQHKGFNLLKLNGSAFVSGDDVFFKIKKGDTLAPFLDMYSRLDPRTNKISFSWEKMNDQYLTRIADCVADARVLVIIGYSFPFFNREVDRQLFERMPKLEKIYIQDPSASTVKMSILPVLSKTQIAVNSLDKNIVLLESDPKQFFMPPEL